MNTIATSVRSRIMRSQLLTIFWSSSQPSLHGKYIVACVRFASTETRSGFLSRLRNIFNRSSDERIPVSPRIRSVMDLAQREVHPAIRDSNAPDKLARNDDKKEPKERNPVTKIDDKVDGKVGEQVYKYQWGVRVPDNRVEFLDEEQSPSYLMTQKWGVHTTEYKELDNLIVQNEIKAIAPGPVAEIPIETNIEKPQSLPMLQNYTDIFEKLSSNVTVLDSAAASSLPLSKNENETSAVHLKLTVTTADILDYDSQMYEDDDYNIPQEVPRDGELLAWRDVVARSKLHEDELARRTMATKLPVEALENTFARPEPQEATIDAEVASSVRKVAFSEPNILKTLDLSPNTVRINFTETKKLHTCGIDDVNYRSFARNYHNGPTSKTFSTSSARGKETFPTDSENPTKTEVTETNDVEASTGSCSTPSAEENLDSVLQDLTQREVESLLSYKQQGSAGDEAPPTSAETTPANESLKETSAFVRQTDDGSLNNDSVGNAEMTELEKTILKLKESEDKEDAKEIKDRKGFKDDDFVRVPGDPYPYNREHYERWRLPHGKCPIVNDDVPKVKPIETNDSPRQ